MSDNIELPELPDLAVWVRENGKRVVYREEMKEYARAYARSAILADRARVAQRELSDPVATVLAEVERAIRKFPTWPTDPLHAVAVLGEEFGELTKAVLQSVYEPHKSTPDDVRTEAIQTAAMALRFLASLDAYRYERGEQHKQERL